MFQIIGLLISSIVIWWAAKRLIAIYTIRFLEKKRFCVKCLDKGDGEIVLNSPWKIQLSGETPIFLCNKCKNENFPGEIGEFAIKRGALQKDDV